MFDELSEEIQSRLCGRMQQQYPQGFIFTKTSPVRPAKRQTPGDVRVLRAKLMFEVRLTEDEASERHLRLWISQIGPLAFEFFVGVALGNDLDWRKKTDVELKQEPYVYHYYTIFYNYHRSGQDKVINAVVEQLAVLLSANEYKRQMGNWKYQKTKVRRVHDDELGVQEPGYQLRD